MPRRIDADRVAIDATYWMRDAEHAYRKAPDGSADQMQAIRTMALAAIAGLVAGQIADKR